MAHAQLPAVLLVSMLALAGPLVGPREAVAERPDVQRFALQGTMGKETPIRLYVERRGKTLDGTYLDVSTGMDTHVHGTMVDAKHFQMSEMRGQDEVAGTFDGAIEGSVMKGVYRTSAETLVFVTQPLQLPMDSFSNDYVGVIGKQGVRVHLELTDLKLAGAYRYVGSTATFTLTGMSDVHGSFLVRERVAARETGKIEGVFLTPTFVVGRWTSPEGTETLPLKLRAIGSHPGVASIARE